VVHNREIQAESETRNPEILVRDLCRYVWKSLCRGFLYSCRMKLLPMGA
jgi:hypothetical protein